MSVQFWKRLSKRGPVLPELLIYLEVEAILRNNSRVPEVVKIRAHQPGSEPIDIPETIPNPVVVPKPTPTPTEPAPKEPVRIPEKVPLQ